VRWGNEPLCRDECNIHNGKAERGRLKVERYWQSPELVRVLSQDVPVTLKLRSRGNLGGVCWLDFDKIDGPLVES
jgi:hypothetical protein